MQIDSKIQNVFELFDQYNSADPETEIIDGKAIPKALLYGQRMTARLNQYEPTASEVLHLTARCQHIGRWEIARKSYSMDKKGYFEWRQVEKLHQCTIAEKILHEGGFDAATIEKVKFLLQKKELQSNSETKLLEDVVCLVFIEYYLDSFAAKHDNDKIVDILQKTMKKMTPRAKAEVANISLSDKIKSLIQKAS